MPPFGLYPMPRHHIYAGNGPRPTFSAKDFDNSPEPDKAAAEPAGVNRECTSPGAQRDHRHGNNGSRLSLEATNLEHWPTLTQSHKESKSDVSKPDKKSKKKARKTGTSEGLSTDSEADEAKMHLLQGAMSSPNTKAKRSKLNRASGHNVSAPAKTHKKRKHERESISGTTDARPSSKVAKIAAQYDELSTALGGIKASLKEQTEVSNMKKDKKNKKRESSKRQSGISKAVVNNASPENDTATAHPAPEASSKKQKTAKPVVRSTDNKDHTPQVFSASVKKSHIPLPDEDTPVKASSSQKHKTRGVEEEPTVQVQSSPIKKTYAPVPAPTNASALSAIRPAKAAKNFDDPDTIIPETPPSRASKTPVSVSKSPIPLPLSSSMPEPQSSPSRPPKSTGAIRKVTVPHPFSSTNAMGQKNGGTFDKRVGSQYVGWPELAPKVTKRITQPLTDEPKPKPRPKTQRSRSRSSSVTSTSSGCASIPEMFSRLSRSLDGIDDPFTTPKANSNALSFTQLFSQLRAAINFTTELEYLAQYKDWHAENTSEYPVPCLGRLTYCSAKREEALRQIRADGTTTTTYYIKTKVTHGPDTTAMHEASHATKIAEQFLERALRAQVPVPTGPLAGTWSLYAPAYSAHHHDEYANGRTLTIFGGFKPNTYKAHLSLPPRTVAFPIRKFEAPPHASFRTAIVKTEQEGYEMDVVFLGNGYLHLRVDLNLLLKGAPTKMGDRKVWMEFVGVYEGAVEWSGKKDGEGDGGDESELEVVMDE